MFVKFHGEALNMDLVTRIRIEGKELIVEFLEGEARYSYGDETFLHEGLEYLIDHGNCERLVRVGGTVQTIARVI